MDRERPRRIALEVHIKLNRVAKKLMMSWTARELETLEKSCLSNAGYLMDAIQLHEKILLPPPNSAKITRLMNVIVKRIGTLNSSKYTNCNVGCAVNQEFRKSKQFSIHRSTKNELDAHSKSNSSNSLARNPSIRERL